MEDGPDRGAVEVGDSDDVSAVVATDDEGSDEIDAPGADVVIETDEPVREVTTDDAGMDVRLCDVTTEGVNGSDDGIENVGDDDTDTDVRTDGRESDTEIDTEMGSENDVGTENGVDKVEDADPDDGPGNVIEEWENDVTRDVDSDTGSVEMEVSEEDETCGTEKVVSGVVVNGIESEESESAEVVTGVDIDCRDIEGEIESEGDAEGRDIVSDAEELESTTEGGKDNEFTCEGVAEEGRDERSEDGSTEVVGTGRERIVEVVARESDTGGGDVTDDTDNKGVLDVWSGCDGRKDSDVSGKEDVGVCVNVC